MTTQPDVPAETVNDKLQTLNPLDEIKIVVTDAEDFHDLEEFRGVTTKVEVTAVTSADSIRIEGFTDELPGKYDRFMLVFWHNVNEDDLNVRNVDGYYYNDDGDRIMEPIGQLETIEKLGEQTREEVFKEYHEEE